MENSKKKEYGRVRTGPFRVAEEGVKAGGEAEADAGAGEEGAEDELVLAADVGVGAAQEERADAQERDAAWKTG